MIHTFYDYRFVNNTINKEIFMSCKFKCMQPHFLQSSTLTISKHICHLLQSSNRIIKIIHDIFHSLLIS